MDQVRRRLHNHPARGFAVIPSDEAFLKTLSEEVQLLITLMEEGHSYEAAADLTGLRVGTVKSKITRARVKILHMRTKAKTETANSEAAHVQS